MTEVMPREPYSGGSWMDRAPAMLRDLEDPDGNPLGTHFDRRWLWRLRSFLLVHGTTTAHEWMQRDLNQYLNETCEHVWRDWAGDQDIAAHRQCLWCNWVEWQDDEPA